MPDTFWVNVYCEKHYRYGRRVFPDTFLGANGHPSRELAAKAISIHKPVYRLKVTLKPRTASGERAIAKAPLGLGGIRLQPGAKATEHAGMTEDAIRTNLYLYPGTGMVFLGSMNDALFIIDRPPSPAGTDAPPHVRPGQPRVISKTWPVPRDRVQAIVDEHNARVGGA